MTLYKNVSTLTSILILSAIFAVTPSMAKDHRKTVALPGGYTISGAVLKRGDYTVEFSDSEGGDATISRNGRVIIRTPYRLVALPERSKKTEVHARANSDGRSEITSMVFRHSRVAISFE